MKILHSSDWHIGRSFHGVNTVDSFLRYTDFLIDTLRDEQVDVLLISGDLYDRAVPPLDAIEAYQSTLERVLELGVKVIITSGNHDSHQRLGVGSRFMEPSGIFLRTSMSDIERPVVLDDGGRQTIVYGIPYLEPALVNEHYGVPRSHSAVLGEVSRRIRAHRNKFHPDATTIVMAHAFVSGAEPSESERSIEIGGVGRAETDIFTWPHYAALGHLHKPQTVAHTVRYSGSPLPYSFSELGTDKLMWLYDTSTSEIRKIPIPEIMHLASLTGGFEELLAKASDYQQHYVQLRLTDEAVPKGALGNLRTAFPGLVNVEWINLHHARAKKDNRPVKIDDGQLFADFIETTTGRAASDSEKELFDVSLEAAKRKMQ